MASSLLLLLDDIATVLDDVAVMTKAAVKKTAGVLGDDLALNAKQVTGVRPARELPVVWAVARGSALNKAMLVPAALATSWLAPWAITPLLMAGGAYLCFEGAEKILHSLFHRGDHAADATHAADDASHGKNEYEAARRTALTEAVVNPSIDPVAVESRKITGAIRTDFILSAEIIVITLGVVAGKPFLTQLAVLVAISAAMTIGVYGLVAGIVKLDDLGALLAARPSATAQAVGRGILAAAPWLMRALSIAGTAAMFLVGGGIIAHGIPAVHDAVHEGMAAILGDSHGPSSWATLLTMAADAAVGIFVGLVLVAALSLGSRLAGYVRGVRAHG
jgi:predicted DNA repair protein MutK